MESNEELLTVSSQPLADELAGISQSMVHSVTRDKWSLDKLNPPIKKQARDETYHPEWLVQCIIFLGGTPVVSKLNRIQIGRTVPEVMGRNLATEPVVVRAYNAAFGFANVASDQATADLLATIHTIEDEQSNWAEHQRTQIDQMGTEYYLAAQTADAAGDS